MGGLDNITGRIKSDATKKAKQRINEAKKEANTLLTKAQKELDKEKKAIEQETEKLIKIQRSRATSEAKLESRKMKLNAKEAVITQAFENANERLKRLGPKQNEKYLRGAIKNAVGLLGKEVEVLCNREVSSLVTRIASEINPRITVSSEGVQYLGGAVIRAKNGTAQIDATFEGVLERIRNDLRREVAGILFTSKQEAKEA
jgi:V/A-type H+-transporting ATPase subunit E